MKEIENKDFSFCLNKPENLELRTDDQKSKAKKDSLNRVSSSGTNYTSMSVSHQPHLESCQLINKAPQPAATRTNSNEMQVSLENSHSVNYKNEVSDSSASHVSTELNYNYPDLVGLKQVNSTKNESVLKPLCEESLKMSGITVAADFPMIDEDDNDENSSSNMEKTRELSSKKPDLVEAVLVKAEMVDEIAVPSQIRLSPISLLSSPSTPTLKSALKKVNGVSKKKKGMRVSFHDTKVFYIDTEAEANAEPQLLTVHSLDLPLAPTDFRVFIPAYDFIPGHVPIANNVTPLRSYTYEDAIASLSSYSDKVTDNDDCDGENEDEEFVAFNDVNKSQDSLLSIEPLKSSAESNENLKTEENLCKSTEIVNKDVNLGETSEGSVRCLTEANLREHEMILMEQDSIIEVNEKSRVNDQELELTQPINCALTKPVITKEKSLSPPLKELMVDVSVLSQGSVNVGLLPGGNPGNSNWQVELSPLNSIPDSETESSTSSQDTIIMMTSEECERNENHIKQSQLSFNNSSKKESTNNSESNFQNANEICEEDSQDSDETLKYVEGNYQQMNSIKNVDVEGNLMRINAAYPSGSPKTSSQIRQLMERNAMKRNMMRYSNTKLKKPAPSTNGGGNEAVNDVQPIEHQRQWRSHESLLDTIKKLTVEESNNEDNIQINADNSNNLGYVQIDPLTANSYRSDYGHHNDLGGLSNGNLSLQDIRDLVNGEENKSRDNGYFSNSIEYLEKHKPTSDAVPGDLRQWKVRSNQWQMAHNSNQSQNSRDRLVNGHTNYFRSTSMDVLQNPGIYGTGRSIPLLENGVARCATLKEQYNNKDFYRVSLSHNYSQSDDHLEMVDNDEERGENDDLINGECSDELSQFVQMDSGRIERLRKRYSYSELDNYNNTMKAFNRRSSVRGIKPRFGSTSEILKQMQIQLQPPSIPNQRNNSSQLPWSSPNNATIPNDHSINECNSSFDMSSTSNLPIREDIYGSTKQPVLKKYNSAGSNYSIYSSVSELRGSMTRLPQQLPNGTTGAKPFPSNVSPNNLGTFVHKQPPPYQPPPPPSTALSQRNNNAIATTTPLRIHTKDERGAPEGASSSPKVLTDSVRQYHSPTSQSLYVGNQEMVGNGISMDNNPIYEKTDTPANNGVVYYVMQV